MAPWRRSLAAAAAGCAALAVAAPPAAGSRIEQRVLEEINDYRAEHDVEPLRRSRSLARSAGRYATHILRVDRLHHHDEVWASSRFDLAGENLAWQGGRRTRPRTVTRLWARSPSHRRILLDPRVDYGGVGREYGRLGDRRATVWVLHVGAR